MSGAHIWLRSAVLHQESYLALTLQQGLLMHQTCHVLEADSMKRQLKSLKASIPYHQPNFIKTLTVNKFSGASFNIGKHMSYGQAGLLTILSFGSCPYVHPIDWFRSKQKRLCHFSYRAKIAFFADADDRGFQVTGNAYLYFCGAAFCIRLFWIWNDYLIQLRRCMMIKVTVSGKLLNA